MIYFDSSVWYAALNAGHESHRECQEILRSERAERQWGQSRIIHNWWLTLSLARWHDRFASMLSMLGIT
jgi:predicted nucleic acid-binding protein